MKVSEITMESLSDYLRLEYDDLSNAERTNLAALQAAAVKFIHSYTGLTAEEMDLHEDFIIVIYILVQDMYDNRSLYVEKDNINRTVSTILGMHSVNLL